MGSENSKDITELFKEIYKIGFKDEGEKVNNIIVEFYPYTTLKNTIRKRKDSIFIRISDLLKEAPLEVLEALGILLFSKLKRKKAPKKEELLYRNFVSSKNMRKKQINIRKKRGKKIILGPKGDFYDLEESFHRVNDYYFNGELKKPILTWNKRKTKTRFGHHDRALNTIVISKTLDDCKIPTYLLDYVMYHELLHIKHDIHYINGRRSVHTKAFKNDENRFKSRKNAEQLLKKLASSNFN